ncbi:MAG: GNAT family N-acetyltransferase [Desulfotomaculum sp.]|nr:GNAT family N-acetyltransferase [Desulfotomaculum sp.]MCL0081249.1 GNAT family N-acetyltransferase [Peptococcaceae bacterium]
MTCPNVNKITFEPENIPISQEMLSALPGTIHFEEVITTEQLIHLSINEGLKNFRPAKRQQQALISIIDLPDAKVFIARYENEIIGYVTFHHPDKYSRWSKHPLALELGAIEVAPQWRKYKIAYQLMYKIFNAAFVEDYIIVTFVYCWNWDLPGSNLSIWEYQRMMTKLFSSVGLKNLVTDDPDILEHPANIMMVRYGEKVPLEDIQSFKQLAFNKTRHSTL